MKLRNLPTSPIKTQSKLPRYLSAHYSAISQSPNPSPERFSDQEVLVKKRAREEMGKIPVKMKAVVYALSPFQQKVMPGLWKDLPGKISHKITDNWISATLLLGPLIGVHTYVDNFKEKEKMEHRY